MQATVLIKLCISCWKVAAGHKRGMEDGRLTAGLGARQFHLLILSDVHSKNSLRQVNKGLQLILGKTSVGWILRGAKRQQLLSLSDATLFILAKKRVKLKNQACSCGENNCCSKSVLQLSNCSVQPNFTQQTYLWSFPLSKLAWNLMTEGATRWSIW